MLTSSGSFTDTPASHSAGGSYFYTEGADSSASQSTTSTEGSSSDYSSYGDSSSSTSTFSYQDAGSYTLTDAGNDLSGHYTENSISLSADGSRESGGASGAGFSSYTGMDSSIGSTSYSESGDHSPGLTTGGFSDQNTLSTTYSFSEFGVTIAPSSTNLYADGDNGWTSGSYSDSGSLSVGASSSRGADFWELDLSADNEWGWNLGIAADASQSGSYSGGDNQATQASSSQWGNFTQSDTPSKTTNYSQSNSSSAAATQMDGGKFTNSFGGTYSDFSSSQQHGSSTESGLTIEKPSGTSTTASFATNNSSLSNVSGSEMHSHGLSASDGASSDSGSQYSSSTYVDNGTYTASGMAVSRNATFSSAQIGVTISDDADSGLYTGPSQGSYSQSAHVDSVTKALTSGSYVSASGTVTEAGTLNANDDSDTQVSRSASYLTSTPSGSTQTSERAATTSYNQTHTLGSYAKTNNAITEEHTQYSAKEGSGLALSYQQQSNTSASGGTQTSYADNFSFSLVMATDDGSHDQSGASVSDAGHETRWLFTGNVSSATLTSSATTGVDKDMAFSLAIQRSSSNGFDNYHEDGSYVAVNGVKTWSGEVDQYDLWSTGQDGTVAAVKVFDPGTVWNSTSGIAAWGENWSEGAQATSQGAVTNADIDFDNTSITLATGSYSASSDAAVIGNENVSPVWEDWKDIPTMTKPTLEDLAVWEKGSPDQIPAAPPPNGFLNSSATASNSYYFGSTSDGETVNTSGTIRTTTAVISEESRTDIAWQSISTGSWTFGSASYNLKSDSITGWASASSSNSMSVSVDGDTRSATSYNTGLESIESTSDAVYDANGMLHNETHELDRKGTQYTDSGAYTTSSANPPPNPADDPNASYSQTLTTGEVVQNSLSMTQTSMGDLWTTGYGFYSNEGGADVGSTKITKIEPSEDINTVSGFYFGGFGQGEATSYSQSTTLAGGNMLIAKNSNVWGGYVRNVDDFGTYSNPQKDGTKTVSESTYIDSTSALTGSSYSPEDGVWHTDTTYAAIHSYTNYSPPPTSGPDGMAADPPEEDATANAGSKAPWYNDSWWDWANPVAYIASSYYGIKEGLRQGYEFLTADHAAEWAEFRKAKDALAYKMADPNSRMTVQEYQNAEKALIAGQARKVIEDAGKFVNGIMAVADLVGVAKIGAKAGVKLAEFGAFAVNSLRSEGLQGGLQSIAARATCIVFNNGNCFAAGTPILTPGGAKPIESFQVGDTVYSRSDEHADGPVRIGIVDAVFERSTRIWEVRVAGKTIATSGEHPFYVVGHGWTPANRLEAGDCLVGHNERCETIEQVVETDRTAIVYNVRVESDHTYFVGEDDWGFSVWAHNANYAKGGIDPVVKGRAGELKAGLKGETKKTIESLSGRAKWRTPDGLTDSVITEVKNRAYVYFSTQLQDYLHYAIMNRLKFVLKVPKGATLSKELVDLWAAGFIEILRF